MQVRRAVFSKSVRQIAVLSQPALFGETSTVTFFNFLRMINTHE